jgi:hypothetical protein
MGEVISLQRERAERAEKTSDATAFSHAITDDRDRRSLPDPEKIDAYYPLLPVDRLAALRCRVEAELAPAGRDGAARIVAVLSKVMKIPGPDVIEDLETFTTMMIGALAGYSSEVLEAALGEAHRREQWFPSANVMVAICDSHVARRRDELRAIDRMEAERRRREAVDEQRRQCEADNRRWLEDLRARFEIAGDAPSLADIELGTYLQRCLRRNGSFVTWRGFADADPRAAAELCRRLAVIAGGNGEPAEREFAIAAALEDAGLDPPAAPLRGRSAAPDSAVPSTRPLAEITSEAIERLIAENRKRAAEWMAQLSEAEPAPR